MRCTPLDQAGALPNSLSPMKAEGGAVINHPALLAGGKASQFPHWRSANPTVISKARVAMSQIGT
jgi:hypothetical protein